MANQKNIDASIKNLETQVGQMAQQLANQQEGAFTANTQTNPKEHCKAMTTRRGKVIGKGIGDNLKVERKVVDEPEEEEQGEEGSEDEAEENNKEDELVE